VKPALLSILVCFWLIAAEARPAAPAGDSARQVIPLVHGVSWGALAAADPQTGRTQKQIVVADAAARIYWLITLVPETGCLWTHLIIDSPTPLDFDKSPIFSVDGGDPVDISAWRSTGYDKNAWIWAFADCDPAETEKIILQFKRGNSLRLRYFLQPQGSADVNLPLKGFTKAYNWLTNNR
jgi:hypothetical protein